MELLNGFRWCDMVWHALWIDLERSGASWRIHRIMGLDLVRYGFIWQDLLRSQPTRVCQGSTLGVVVSKLTSEAWEIAGLHLFTKGSCFLRQVENFMISYDIMISLYRCHFSHFIAIGPPDRMDRRRISTCACIPQSSSMAQLYRLDFSQVFALVSKCIQPSV